MYVDTVFIWLNALTIISLVQNIDVASIQTNHYSMVMLKDKHNFEINYVTNQVQ